MPACCCPVHEGQAGLVIGDMHGLYVHTHIWIMGPLSTRLGNRVEQFVCGGGGGVVALFCGCFGGNTASIHASLLRMFWEAQM